MKYYIIYWAGTVQVAACVRQCVANQKYRHDPRYTMVPCKIEK